MKYAALVTAAVPQSEPLDARQVINNAGGFVYQLDDWARLDRFLILGSDAPTYYQSARALTRDNARCVERCYAADAERTVNRIAEISDAGRAPKNDAAIFALAVGATSADTKTRQLALAKLGTVCRTGTHLFQFVTVVRALGRGWGRTLKRAVGRWYETRSPDALALQVIKYRSRETYTHKRLLQTAHPTADDTAKVSIYRWVCGKEHDRAALPGLVVAHLDAMSPATTDKALVDLVRAHRLPWEAIPTAATTRPDVWRAMLPELGLTALIRNLGKMTAIEAITPFSPEAKRVVRRLTDKHALRKSRIHPFNVLLALAVYRQGKGVRGELSWRPIPVVRDALEKAFYLAFANVKPTGKRTLIALDVSGSMTAPLMGAPLQVCEGAAAMAMVTMRTEGDWHVMAFDHGLRHLGLKGSESLAEVLRKTRGINFGGTDCALPMIEAARRGWAVDTFVVYTDNETWAGKVHPVEALRDYRKRSGIPAKLIVVGMTSTGFSIADANDGGMLDVVGFDSAAPAVIADFARH